MEPTADIAVIGLAVMGQNLIMNMNDHGFTVVAYNRTVAKVDEFIAEHKYEIIPRGDGTKYSHEVEYEVSEYELDDVNVSINTGSSGFKTEFSPCKIEDETDKEKSGGIALCLSGRQERIAIRVLERIEAERNEGKSQS